MQKNEIQLAVNQDSPAVAVEMPNLRAARASAEFTDDGNAIVSLQDSSGRVVFQINFEPTRPAKTQRPTAQAKPPARVAAKPHKTTKPGRKPLPMEERKRRALTDLRRRIVARRKIPEVSVLARGWKVGVSTAAAWIAEWETRGDVPERKRVGNRKVFVNSAANGYPNGAMNGHVNGEAHT